MTDAGEELKRALRAAFAALASDSLLPEGETIAAVHSWGWTEDAKTFSVYLDLSDGRTAIISCNVGGDVSVTLH